jgi:hypothetical protein
MDHRSTVSKYWKEGGEFRLHCSRRKQLKESDTPMKKLPGQNPAAIYGYIVNPSARSEHLSCYRGF